MPTHPYVELAEHGQRANIDEGMVDLIRALWRHGITTTNCCQGDPSDDWNSAYVAMEASDVPRFLDLVGDRLEVPAAAVKRHLNIHLGATPANSICWSNGMREQFAGTVYWMDGKWHVQVTVRFPPLFIPELTAVLEAA